MAAAAAGDRPLWTPGAEQVLRARMTEFMRHVREEGVTGILDYPALYEWSVEHPDEFWAALWRYCGVIADDHDQYAMVEETTGEFPVDPLEDPLLATLESHEDKPRQPWEEVVVGLERMAPPDPDVGPRWFTGARLNFAENLLRHEGDATAIVAWDERGRQRVLSFDELRAEVARVAAALRGMGIVPGDRIAGFLPNVPEAVIAMLAAASVGAIWSSCSPDFGVKGVLDRFGQIEPRVLFCADGYRYAGKEIDCLARVRTIAEQIPAITHVVVVPYRSRSVTLAGIRAATTWSDFQGSGHSLGNTEAAHLPFDHPV